MREDIFLSDFNSISNRWVIFEDDGISGWLYLTKENEKKPQYDCWIYNRIEAPSKRDLRKYRDAPPPATDEYTGENAFVSSSRELNIKFKWTKDGNAVALLINEKPYGYISTKNNKGYSMNLVREGPWGTPFNHSEYVSMFE